jgi:predicted enzyme related to lactoylglutathione lyase
VIFNTENSEPLVTFWRALLGVGILKIDETLGITWLQPDQDDGITVGIQQVSTRHASTSNVHLDIAVDDRDATRERVLALGGCLIAEHDEAGMNWYIMADPEDNHFCIYHE